MRKEKVFVACSGGCGRTASVTKRKAQHYDYYLCDSRESGQRCRDLLPPLKAGFVRSISHNGFAHFTGVSDRVATVEDQAAVARARALVAAAARLR
jgi:hypothetical protein